MLLFVATAVTASFFAVTSPPWSILMPKVLLSAVMPSPEVSA
jgi:hypothetical protein